MDTQDKEKLRKMCPCLSMNHAHTQKADSKPQPSSVIEASVGQVITSQSPRALTSGRPTRGIITSIAQTEAEEKIPRGNRQGGRLQTEPIPPTPMSWSAQAQGCHLGLGFRARVGNDAAGGH